MDHNLALITVDEHFSDMPGLEIRRVSTDYAN
jgi:hypothetical protein